MARIPQSLKNREPEGLCRLSITATGPHVLGSLVIASPSKRRLEWPGKIIEPSVSNFLFSAKRAGEKAMALAEDYDEQPISAIAAVAIRELAVMKLMERLRNINEDIV